MAKTKDKAVLEVLELIREHDITNFYYLMNYLSSNNFELFKVVVDNHKLIIELCEN